MKINTPWKTICVSGAEADDVILCLAQFLGKTEEVLILSSDKDMIQAPRITEKTEFTDSFKEYLKNLNLNITPKEFLNLQEEEQTQITDNFNILNKKNEKDIWKNIKLGSKKIQKMIQENTLEEFLNSNELYKENYERNKILVLQEYIPTEIYNSGKRQNKYFRI